MEELYIVHFTLISSSCEWVDGDLAQLKASDSVSRGIDGLSVDDIVAAGKSLGA